VYFRANPDSPVFEELKNIMVKTGGVADVLRERLRPLAADIRVAFLFGSFAAGESHGRSDIDVMLIGSLSFADVVDALGDVQLTLRREVNPTVYPVTEFQAKHELPFMQSVLSKPKVFLIGAEDDLEGLVGQRLAD
jgi:predicted nucleotidyltransferase